MTNPGRPLFAIVAVLLVACVDTSAPSVTQSRGVKMDPMPTTITLEAAGLFTNPNPLGGQVPDGAMSRAVNVVSDRPGVITPRRGMRALDYPLSPVGSPSGRSGTFYRDTLHVHTDGDQLRYDVGAGFDPVMDEEGEEAVIAAPTQFDVGARVRFAESLGKLYFTTSTGLLELDGIGAQARRPGAPRAYDLNAADITMETSGTGHLVSGGVTAYRIAFGFNDAQGRPVIGAPSGRRIVKNPIFFPATLSRTSNVVTVDISPGTFPTNFEPYSSFKVDVTPINADNPSPERKTVSGAAPGDASFTHSFLYSETGADFAATGGFTIAYPPQNTTLNIPIPDQVRVGDFVQIYRTASVRSVYDDPGDNMGQVGEVIITSAMKTAGSFEFPDSTPDGLRGPPLYTNATQEGLTQANERAPIARDLTIYRDSLFLANVVGPNRLSIRFLGVPTFGDTLTIAGQNYVGLEFPSGSTSYVVSQDINLTTSQQIEATARNLVVAINGRSASPVTAAYASSDSDPPGIIILEEKVISTSAFTAISSAHGEVFEPQLVSAATSTQDVRPNRLHYSKPQQPYAFPLGNTLPIGSEDSAILRILALRDSLIVLKEGTGPGKGVWRVTGTGPGTFAAAQVNVGADVLAPESAVVIDNQVAALTSSGVVMISEAGVDTIDLAISDKMQALITTAGEALAPVAHAVAYESNTERKYILWVPEDDESGVPVQAYVYNLNTDTWTTRDDAATFAVVGSPFRRLYTGDADGRVLQERRAGTVQDYVGPQVPGVTGTVVSSAANVFIASTVEGLEVGQAIWTDSSGPENSVRIDAINPTTKAVTTTWVLTATPGDSWYVAEPINISVAWTVNSAGSPTTQKQFYDSTLLFEEAVTGEWTFHFNADLDPTTDTAQGYAEGTPYCRVEVPWESQRTTRLGVRVDHAISVEKPNIVGVSSLVNIYSGFMAR